MRAGSWITSLTCSVLAAQGQSAKNVASGLKWLCDDFPRDSSPWMRFVQSLRPKSHIHSQNDLYRGWGWTPKTASWVEPTAFALLALSADPVTDSGPGRDSTLVQRASAAPNCSASLPTCAAEVDMSAMTFSIAAASCSAAAGSIAAMCALKSARVVASEIGSPWASSRSICADSCAFSPATCSSRL